MTRKFKLTLTPYQKAAATVWGISLLLLAAGLFGLYWPQHEKLQQLHKQYEESYEQALAAKEATSLETCRRLEEQVLRSTAQVGAFTVNADQVNGLVFEIGRLAGQLNLAGFSSKSVNVQTTEKTPSKQRISEMWLSVDFQGTYQQFARFVNLLERNTPAIFVEKVSGQRDTKDGTRCTFQMELSMLMSTNKTEPKVVAKAE